MFYFLNVADGTAEEFSKQLDLGHKATCPWRGNSCPESLVQFPPTPPSALIGGYKDRCDGLLQFAALPVVAASAIEQMHASRGSQIDRFLANSVNFLIGEPSIKMENTSGVDSREEAYSLYSHVRYLRYSLHLEKHHRFCQIAVTVVMSRTWHITVLLLTLCLVDIVV